MPKPPTAPATTAVTADPASDPRRGRPVRFVASSGFSWLPSGPYKITVDAASGTSFRSRRTDRLFTGVAPRKHRAHVLPDGQRFGRAPLQRKVTGKRSRRLIARRELPAGEGEKLRLEMRSDQMHGLAAVLELDVQCRSRWRERIGHLVMELQFLRHVRSADLPRVEVREADRLALQQEGDRDPSPVACPACRARSDGLAGRRAPSPPSGRAPPEALPHPPRKARARSRGNRASQRSWGAPASKFSTFHVTTLKGMSQRTQTQARSLPQIGTPQASFTRST